MLNIQNFYSVNRNYLKPFLCRRNLHFNDKQQAIYVCKFNAIDFGNGQYCRRKFRFGAIIQSLCPKQPLFFYN